MATHAAPPASRGPPSEAAIKERIMKHMNADHADSLALYLQHYTPYTTPSPATSPPPQLTDISLSSLTILHYPTNNTIPTGDALPVSTTIPLNPPMTSYADSRVRLVAMAEEAQEAIESRKIKRLESVTLPNVFGLVVAVLVAQVFVFFCPGVVGKVTFPTYRAISTTGEMVRRLDLKGSTPYTRFVLLGYEPLIRVLWRWRSVFFWTVLAVHAAEAVVLDGRLVKRYGVRRFGKVWWGWIGWVMTEGFGALKRSEATWRRETGYKAKAEGKKV